jgi:hypothetical protein
VQAQWEFTRVFIQCGFIFVMYVVLLSVVLRPWVGPPLELPGRVLDDTFGANAFSRLWHTEPLWMNRTRYETPGNLFHPVTFASDTPLGQVQDMGFDLWNWGVRNIYQGPIHMKLFTLFVTGCIWIPAQFIALLFLSKFDMNVVWFHCNPIKAFYLRWTPERLLVLEQLIAAHAIGRKLSVGTNSADVEAATGETTASA